ncbi:NACHT domain-containing protein [Actinomadura viridis]|uniref:NACHT domain-containing protein n=1 Tax=Actinomadura viridis TaxID=58110 RepID=A0A931DNA0_9ACTN|nr:NACHT domain-containing protein [Actinomadura viridis]MBG6090736.1 hypothetical protein [Actinomadura viridis]
MSVEVAALGVGRSVAQLAVGRLLAARGDRTSPSKDLVELIRTGFPDDIRRRRVERQFEDIADSVTERLLTFCRHEFGGLTDGDRQATLHQVVLTLREADLSDAALLADDADPVRLARRLRGTLPARRAGSQLGEAGARLYDVVLDECCDCLARIIVHLPQFEPRAAAETLGRLTGLADQVAAVLARLPARSLDAPEGESGDAEFTRRYLASVSEGLDSLELFGVRFERFARPRTALSVAYVSLNVSDESGRQEPVPPMSEWREHRGGGAVRVETALKGHRLTLVRGEAGGGKSTLLRWLAVTAARGAFTGDLADWNGCVPFLVKLRSHAGGPLPRPEELLDDVAGNLTGIMPRGWVHRRLSSGRALLLVDGVDEVTASQRQAVRRWLKGLAGDFPGIRAVVTSRPAAATSDWLRAEGFTPAFIEPLGPADLRALIRQWHLAVRDCDDLPCAPERLPSYEARLLARMEAAPHLRGLASTPLLAAMLCALNLDRETLPRDRMGLYAAALDLLLETRDAKRNVPSAADVVLQRDQKVHILQALAWHLSLSRRVELPRTTAEQVIRERLLAMPGVDARASDVLEYLLQRSGVVREPVPGRIDFVHRTVQEYLTAKQIADLGDMELLVANAHRDQWRETVIMAAGHAIEPLRRDLVAGLLARARAEPKRARQLELLAVACLETLPSIPRELRESLDRCLDELVPPRGVASARSLASAGEAVLARLPERLDGLSTAAARAAVRTAWMINGPGALDVLARYAPDERPEVWGEVQEGWRYFDPEEYATRVLAPASPGRPVTVTGSRGRLDALRLLSPLSELYVSVDGPADPGFLTPHAESLESLTLMFPGGSEADFGRLPRLPRVRDFSLGLPGMTGLGFLESLPALRSIWLTQCEEVRDFSPLRRYTDLSTCTLYGSRHLTRLDTLPPLGGLTTLGLEEAPLTCGLAELVAEAPRLERLFLLACDWVRDLSPLAGLPLRHLILGQCSGVEDLSPLSGLDELTLLNVSGTAVRDPAPLAGARGLTHLYMDECEITDLSPLARSPRLRWLSVHGLPPGVDLEPLAANPKLTVQIGRGQEVRGGEALGRRLRRL